MEKTLDISRHQGRFDAQQAKAEGITTVMIRACYSTSRDRLFEKNAVSCKKAGLRTGAYLFLTSHYRQNNAGDETVAAKMMDREVTALLETLEGSGVTSWVALDQELEKGYTMGLTREANTRLLNRAAAQIRAAGYAPCLYCSAAWLEGQVKAERLTVPVWAAYYYQSPNDPDFSGCHPLQAVNTRWGRYLLGLGHQLCCWQFGSRGFGGRYGADSLNIDRDWMFYQPEELALRREKAMGFEAARPGLLLRVLREKNPCCEAFPLADVNSGGEALPMNGLYRVLKQGPEQWAGGMEGRWYKIDRPGHPYVLALPDRSVIEKEAAEQAVSEIKITGRGSQEEFIRAVVEFIRSGGLSA